MQLGDIVERMIALADTPVAIQWGDVTEEASTDVYQPKELEELGWMPTIPLGQSLKDMIGYSRARKEETR